MKDAMFVHEMGVNTGVSVASAAINDFTSVFCIFNNELLFSSKHFIWDCVYVSFTHSDILITMVAEMTNKLNNYYELFYQ